MGDDRPDPLSDTLKGLGLLFRAARTVVRRLPTKDLEEAVSTSAREVGRAIENVATTLERGVLRRKDGRPPAAGADARPRTSESDPKKSE
ncbi:MAG: hypothetical protein ABSC94_09780 [Polyangiaceae bacterium]|jgi:hypothetical protein